MYEGSHCEFVKLNCKDSLGGNFNFFELYYCTFDDIFGKSGKLYAFIPFVLVLGFVLLYCLATTADEYLSPTLEFMTKKFGLSESLAGVTFLALGNGSPDVFTSIAAIGSSSPSDKAGNILTISQLVGSAFFITTCVISLSTRASDQNKQINVTKSFFIRDFSFYLLTMVYLLVCMLVIGYVNIYVSVGFILIYTVFIIIVLVQSKTVKAEDDKKE